MQNLDFLIESKIDEYMNKLQENSTEDAAAACKAAIKFYEDQEKLDDKGKGVLNTLKGILAYYNKNGSFTPDQAKAIYNVSKGIKDITK